MSKKTVILSFYNITMEYLMKNKWVKWSLITVGVLVILKIITSLFDSSGENDNKATISKENIIKDSVSEKENIDGVKIGLLKALIKEHSKGYDFSRHYTNKESLFSLVKSLNMKSVLVNESLKSENTEIKELATKGKKLLSDEQLKAFPEMREAFRKSLNKSLIKNGILVSLSGKDNKELTLMNNGFSDDKTVMEFQKSLQSSFKLLRFDKIIYQWGYGNNKHSYYEIKSEPDSKVINVNP